MDICRLLPQTRVPELVVSLVALAVLIVVKEINACYSKKLPLPVPIELIVVSPPLTFVFLLFITTLESHIIFIYKKNPIHDRKTDFCFISYKKRKGPN